LVNYHSKYFTLAGPRFSEKSIGPVFLQQTKLQKSSTASTNPPFFVFEIRIPQDAMSCEMFGIFHCRKFKKTANKAIKKTKTQNFNRGNSITLFNHCLLQEESLSGLGTKTNAKTEFKT